MRGMTVFGGTGLKWMLFVGVLLTVSVLLIVWSTTGFPSGLQQLICPVSDGYGHVSGGAPPWCRS